MRITHSAPSIPLAQAQLRHDAAAVLEAHSQLLHLVASVLLDPLDPGLAEDMGRYAGQVAAAQAAARRIGLNRTDLDQGDLDLLAALAADAPDDSPSKRPTLQAVGAREETI